MDRTVSALMRRGVAFALSAVLAAGALGAPAAFAYAAEGNAADTPATGTPAPDAPASEAPAPEAPAPEAPAPDAPSADGDATVDGSGGGAASNSPSADDVPAKPAAKAATKVSGLNRTDRKSVV